MTEARLQQIESKIEWAHPELGYIRRQEFEELTSEIRRCWSEIVSLRQEVQATQTAYAEYLQDQGR